MSCLASEGVGLDFLGLWIGVCELQGEMLESLCRDFHFQFLCHYIGYIGMYGTF